MSMQSISASEAKNRFGTYIEAALIEPVLIERSGRPAVMLISVAEYQRLKRHEQQHWASLEAGYAAMAADEVREQEAGAWINGLSKDAADKTW